MRRLFQLNIIILYNHNPLDKPIVDSLHPPKRVYSRHTRDFSKINGNFSRHMEEVMKENTQHKGIHEVIR